MALRKEDYINIFATLVVLAAISAFVYYQSTEKFYSVDYYPKNVNYVSGDPTILSNGTVQKTLLDDGDYLYEYFYNLPNSFSEFHVVRPGVLFNEKLPKRTYSVLAGESKESLKKIGELTRRGDGYHIFSLKTKENYKSTAVALDDKAIHYLDL